VGDYFGLAPGIYQSGDVEIRGRITREGDALVRTLLVEAANSVIFHYRGKWSLKSWALRLKEKKGAGKARVALARKLAVLLWRLWKNESAFVMQPA
jgi:transposase